MDQVRTIVKALWRQRFWLLSLFCVIVSMACWWMAKGTISEQFAKNKSTIDSKFSSINTLNSQQVFPNEAVNSADSEEVRKQRDFVRQVWEELYGRQRDVVLKWPVDKLSPEFGEKIEGKMFLQDIEPEMRTLYWNYIKKQFPALLEIVEAREGGSSSGGGRGGYGYGEGGLGEGMGRPMRTGNEDGVEEKPYLVEWLDQDNARRKLSFSSRPSSTQIWVTQEDLWVYETLLNVIADTNKARGANRPDNTAVSEIVALEVGSDAAMKMLAKASIIIPQGSSRALGGGYGGGYGGEVMGGYGGEMGAYGGGEMGGEYGGEVMGGGGYGGEAYGGGEYGGEMMGGGFGRGGEGVATDDTLLANRYVDQTGTPLATSSPTELTTAEFRRLPVRMQLMMDQRWIPRFLVECANAPLPVVVERVRVNPELSGTGSQNPGMRSRGGGRSMNSPTQFTNPNLADVEVQGVIYIYNPPSETVLALPEDGTSNQLTDADTP